MAIGDFLSYVHDQLEKKRETNEVFTLSGSVYFERMKKLGLYITDEDRIRKKIRALGLRGVFS